MAHGLLGHPAAEEFVDFLNSSFSFQKEDGVAVVATQFENRLVREASAIRLEIADLRAETRTEIAEVRTEIAELRGETTAAIAGLRAEMKADFASIQKDIAGLHGQNAGLHGQIAGLDRDTAAQTGRPRSALKTVDDSCNT